jgi:hypothetical protein
MVCASLPEAILRRGRVPRLDLDQSVRHSAELLAHQFGDPTQLRRRQLADHSLAYALFDPGKSHRPVGSTSSPLRRGQQCRVVLGRPSAAPVREAYRFCHASRG